MNRNVTGSCLVVLALASLTLGSGCRNQCGTYQPWRPFARTAIVPPPPTHSLNIPGQTQASTPYYAPGTATPAPFSTPPAGQANPGAWGPANTAQRPPGTPMSFQTAPANPGPFNPLPNQYPTQYQVATASTLGNSRVISPDFSTTQTNERLDPTRMPVADATRSHAPQPFQNQMAGNQMNGRLGFRGSFNQPTQTNPFQATPNPILAQSTTGLPNSPNAQNGWRNSQSGVPGMINR